MMCYLDRTFCVSPNCHNECGRQLNDEIKEAADKWWGQSKYKAPIAMAYFCDNDGNFEF